MVSLFRRAKPAPTVIVDRVEPVEIPVLTEAKRRVGQGDVAGSVLYAYPRVVEDLGRAYPVSVAPDRTHEEILGASTIPETGHLTEFLRRLFALYEPLRYGGTAPPLDGEAVLGLLQSIYSSRPMWQLYIEPKRAPTDRPRPSEATALPGAGPTSSSGSSS